jgi:hypothetical protein
VADENGIVGLDDNEVTDAAESDGSFLGDDDVAAGIECDDPADEGVVVGILAKVVGEGCPGADIIPVVLGDQGRDIGGFLHDGEVDGDLGKFREIPGKVGLPIPFAGIVPDEVFEFRLVSMALGEPCFFPAKNSCARFASGFSTKRFTARKRLDPFVSKSAPSSR